MVISKATGYWSVSVKVDRAASRVVLQQIKIRFAVRTQSKSRFQIIIMEHRDSLSNAVTDCDDLKLVVYSANVNLSPDYPNRKETVFSLKVPH